MVIHRAQFCKMGQKEVMPGETMSRMVNSDCLRQFEMTQLAGNASVDETYLLIDDQTMIQGLRNLC